MKVLFKFESATVITVLSEEYTFEVTAPENFIVSSASSVGISPKIQLASIEPVVVSGNKLTIVTDSTKSIPSDTFAVTFPAMNPTTIPTNNVWVFSVYYGATVFYTAPLEGYRFNETTSVVEPTT